MWIAMSGLKSGGLFQVMSYICHIRCFVNNQTTLLEEGREYAVEMI